MALTLTISVFNAPVASFANLPYAEGTNVQKVMETAYDEAQPSEQGILRFTLEYFGSSLGYEVLTFDAISAQSGSDGSAGAFWELLINGEISNTGIDTTFPADGDSIAWNYTGYSPERHAGTRYETIHQRRG